MTHFSTLKGSSQRGLKSWIISAELQEGEAELPVEVWKLLERKKHEGNKKQD